jgi:hypothetical protein
VRTAVRAKRGRPSKFGRPSQVAAITLPDEVVKGLKKIHPDLAWAIVTLFEKSPKASAAPVSNHQPDAELVKIAERRSLIVVNRAAFRSLPGINIVPLDATHAFLALDAGKGLADLELTVVDRLEGKNLLPRERKALAALRDQLSGWRHDRSLTFHSRAVIVVERTGAKRHRG